MGLGPEKRESLTYLLPLYDWGGTFTKVYFALLKLLISFNFSPSCRSELCCTNSYCSQSRSFHWTHCGSHWCCGWCPVWWGSATNSQCPWGARQRHTASAGGGTALRLVSSVHWSMTREVYSSFPDDQNNLTFVLLNLSEAIIMIWEGNVNPTLDQKECKGTGWQYWPVLCPVSVISIGVIFMGGRKQNKTIQQYFLHFSFWVGWANLQNINVKSTSTYQCCLMCQLHVKDPWGTGI